MANIDKLVHNLYQGILDGGYEYFTDNREVGYKQLSSANLDISLQEFPLLTTKKMFTKGIAEELIWFLKGYDNIKPLLDKGVNIWNEDAYKYYLRIGRKNGLSEESDRSMEDFIQAIKDGDTISLIDGYTLGDVGRNYGVQWRHWQGFSEIFKLRLDTNALPSKMDGDAWREALLSMQNQGLMWVDDSPSIEPILKNVDQITHLLDGLRKPNPINRRHIVTAWNPAELDETALPPCHWAFEVIPRPLSWTQRIQYSGGDQEYLDALWQSAFGKEADSEAKDLLTKELAHIPTYGFILKWHQRSVDSFLGLPFNIASYALLAHIIGSITNMLPMSIIGDLSNVHFYMPHLEAVGKQLSNSPVAFPGCRLEFSEKYISVLETYKIGMMTFDEFLDELTHEDFIFKGYESFPEIKAKMYAPTK